MERLRVPTDSFPRTGRVDSLRYHIMFELEFSPPATRDVKACLSRARSLYLLGEHDAACELYAGAEHHWHAPGEVLNNLGLCRIRCVPLGYLSFGPIEQNIMFSVTSVCTRRTGAAARVERRRRER